MNNLLFDATPLFSGHRFRGIGRYVNGIINGFIDNNLSEHVDLLTLNNEIVKDFSCFSIIRPKKPATRFHWIINYLLSEIEVSRTGKRVFHTNDFRNIPISKKFKTIATAYDLVPLLFKDEYSKNTPKDEIFGFINYTLNRYKKVDHIVAISQATKNDFIKYLNIDSNRISVIYPAYDNKIFFKTNIKSDILPNSKYFLYVGAHDYRKNIELQLRAFALICDKVDEKFLFVGKLTNTEELQFKCLVKDLNISNKVVLLSYVNDYDLNILYNNATAFIFMTLSEGFGLPVLEAMAVGLPVISSNIDVINEIVDGQAILVDFNIEQVADEMYKVSTNQTYRNSFINSSINQAQKFSWKNTAKETFDLYKEI